MFKMLVNNLQVIGFLCILKALDVACAGCIQLDEYTFDKMINKFEASLVNFDVAFPYGDQYEAFGNIAKEAKHYDNLLVAEVGIKDYGERDNEALAKRYNVLKEDYPVTKLFLRGKAEPITLMEKPLTEKALRTLVKEHAGIHLSLPGCIPVLDLLAIKFAKAKDSERPELLTEAEKALAGFKNQDAITGKFYYQIMKKAIEKGNDFVSNETERLYKLLEGKLSEEKKKEIRLKLNILKSFDGDAKHSKKEEL